MSLAQLLIETLQTGALPRTDAPQTLSVHDEAGRQLEVDAFEWDRIGLSFRELRLTAPALAGRSVDDLKQWADRLSQQVTYLLEGIGPLEVDREAEQVLLRSTPPDRQPDATSYYEVVLRTPGTLALRRYRAIPGQSGRDTVDVHLTLEVLRKLVGDLVKAADGV